MLAQGDPAPWFEGRSTVRPTLSFQHLGGQYVVLSFLGSATFAPSRQLVEEIERERGYFDVCDANFFGISVDPEDEKQGRLRQKFPRVYYLWDFDASISRLYGAARADGKYLVHSLVLDPNLRVLAVIPSEADNRGHACRIIECLKSVPPVSALEGFAPILVLPNVFEPQLCRELIDRHQRDGGEELGIVVDVNGQTVRKIDHGMKRTRDLTIADPALVSVIDDRLRRRVFPEIKKAFQFTATQIERFVVACYDAADGGGYFRPHRDNTTRATAHRRFAVSLALDDTAYEGGRLHFPEYGSRGYRAPTGGAVVFSCTLAHEVRPVTRGKRYACLPFIYDDESARLREANRQFLSENLK